MFRYNGKSQNLRTKPEKFRNELYYAQEDGWKFSGLINHSLEIQKMEEASAGLDKALETLQSQMASIKQQRDAQKCVCHPLYCAWWTFSFSPRGGRLTVLEDNE
jgi:RNA polymerase II elongation factor ELL